MEFSSLEIIVLIFILISLIKLITILIKKEKWISVIEIVYKNSKISSVLFLILAIVVFYYLINNMDIVEIFAALVFSYLLIIISFMFYSKEMVEVSKKILKKKFSFWMKGYIIVWVLLIGWCLYEIFI
ncbi:MAG: hypothetical protein QW727_02490 [Candidatus Pacearchaeota archaeon]